MGYRFTLEIAIIFLLCFIAFQEFNFNQRLAEEKPLNDFIRNDIQGSHLKVYDHPLLNELSDSNLTIEKISGASMRPTLFDGNRIICEKYPYEEGDLIKFEDGEGDLILHRIKTVYEDKIITQGDYNRHQDTPINHSQVICTVLGIIY